MAQFFYSYSWNQIRLAMSQNNNKNKTHDKADQQKPAEDVKKHVEKTGKKVNHERSKHNTDQQVKEKVTGAKQGAPPY
jgi:hypothetical protein